MVTYGEPGAQVDIDGLLVQRTPDASLIYAGILAAAVLLTVVLVSCLRRVRAGITSVSSE
jgi:hypothetical protein